MDIVAPNYNIPRKGGVFFATGKRIKVYRHVVKGMLNLLNLDKISAINAQKQKTGKSIFEKAQKKVII